MFVCASNEFVCTSVGASIVVLLLSLLSLSLSLRILPNTRGNTNNNNAFSNVIVSNIPVKLANRDFSFSGFDSQIK